MQEGEGVTRSQVRLAELVDPLMAREALDILGRATGAPVELRDSQGAPLSSDNSPSTFCKVIRSSRRGMDLCRKGPMAHCSTRIGDTTSYTSCCDNLHFVSPICLNGERAGAIVIGPVRPAQCNEETVRERARLLALPEDQLVEAARDIPMLPLDQTEKVIGILSQVSVHLSELSTRRMKSLALEMERQRGIEEISTLRHIVDILNSGLDVEKTLRSIADFAVQMTGSDAAIVRLREHEELVFKAGVGLKTEGRRRPSIPVGKGLTGKVAATGEPISSVDAQQSEEAILAKFLEKENLHAYLSVPIRIRGKVVGVLTTFKRKRYRYSENDIRRLGLLANETAMAVDNALLYEERVRAEKRASLLAEASKIFTSSLDIEEVLQTVTEKIGESLDVLCTISLPLDDGITLVHKAAFHPNPAKIDLLKKMVSEVPSRVGVGIGGRVFKSGKLLFIDGGGPGSFPDPDRPYFRAINMTSAISVPLRMQDRVSGALVVAIIDSDRRFEEGDVVLVQSLAVRAAIALENAQLYRRAEEERVRLEAVISGMADGVVLVDKGGEISAINRAGQEMFAKYWDVGAGTRFDPMSTSHNSHPSPLEDLPLNEVLKHGTSVINAEMTFTRTDGELRTCQVSAAPVRDYDSNITGAVAVFRDVTALKEIERLKDELISVVSHEFRAPLTAISGYTQMLIRQLSKKEDVDRELGEANLVLAHTQRLAGMVRDLLDISRIESGHFSLRKRITMLPTLIDAVAGRQRAISGAHNIVVRAPKDFPPMYMDPDRVEQILDNLISNAIKYSPGGGQVLVTLKLDGDCAVVSVRDWGIGVDQKFVPRLFERFYRVDNRESREFEGIGLGLHVSKLLVEAHKGCIWLNSRKGHGSTFSFSIPLIGGDRE